MITNLVATIFFTITTNQWATVSKTIPVNTAPPWYLIYQTSTLHQVSPIHSNTVMRIKWKDATHDVIVEQTVVGEAKRDVQEDNSNNAIYLNSPDRTIISQ